MLKLRDRLRLWLKQYGIIGVLGMVVRRLRVGHWSMFSEEMFRETGTTIDAETDMTDFTPDFNGRLVKIIIDTGGVAATSLIESGYIRIVTRGNPDIVVPFNGIGLETVPRAHKPMTVLDCDIPVKAGVPIHGKYYYNVTPVTPELAVYGQFIG